MFNEKIKEIQAKMEGLTVNINTQAEEIKAKLEGNDLEAAKDIKNKREENKSTFAQLESELDLYQSVLETNTVEASGKSKPVKNDEEIDYRDAVNNFIRSKGQDVKGLKIEGKDEIVVPYNVIRNEIVPTADGVKKTNTTSITSDDILYTPTKEVNTVVDLKQFTRVIPAKKGKGSYPVLKKATTKMVSVAELEKNPALAKPEFDDVDWSVLTYRGAIPLSQESIDDADVDLVAIVKEHSEEIKLNTTNDAVATVMKTFAPKTVIGLDDLKAIQNVALDPAYNIAYVVSQSFYQYMDTVKDSNGRYMLQDSIISPTGKVFSGKTLFVVNDLAFGAEGTAHAWVGDMKRAILFADRKNLGLRWADNEIYGQYLQAVTRFDVKVADENAGFFLTYTAPVGE
ncbi:phage major capsid protein [Carnobacterium sp. ISL-102]|uniref:phage major capsid protein n=1 Tax=Carnobacterium sp. ISL-102 TaxID=2819142 RepID=UPI001BEA7581|nr:phage major capsid protein [Carnobacterium sp. ISL-102]MBT2732113.1 phage major capsid protein [Carnobacterium sp. ISL-102]